MISQNLCVIFQFLMKYENKIICFEPISCKYVTSSTRVAISYFPLSFSKILGFWMTFSYFQPCTKQMCFANNLQLLVVSFQFPTRHKWNSFFHVTILQFPTDLVEKTTSSISVVICFLSWKWFFSEFTLKTLSWLKNIWQKIVLFWQNFALILFAVCCEDWLRSKSIIIVFINLYTCAQRKADEHWHICVTLLSSVDFDEDACCDRTDPKQMDTAGGSVETKDGLFGGWE